MVLLDALSTGETSCPGYYCQVYRNGRIEKINAEHLGKHRKNTNSIDSIAYEKEIISSVQKYLIAYAALSVEPPIIVMLTLVEVRGVNMYAGPPPCYCGAPIDRDTLLLPDIAIEDFSEDVGRALRPIFDAVWNATGFERSLNYDDNGNWCEHR